MGTNINKSTIWLTSGIVIAVIFVLWLTSAKQPEPAIKISIADASQPVFALVYIAASKGYFTDAGLDVDFHSFTSGRDALNSVIAGESDIATVFETPVVHQVFHGHDLSVITQLHHSTRNTALLVRKDKGIATLNDLSGKRIGVPKDTNAAFFLSQLLAINEISESSIIFVDLDPNEMLAAMKNNAVDAVAIWNPYLFNIQSALTKERVTSFYSDVYTEFSVLAALRKTIEDKREGFDRLMQSLARAEQFLKEHPEESIKIIIEMLPTAIKPVVPHIWDQFDPELKLDNVMLAILNSEAEWLKKMGYYPDKEADFAEIIDASLLIAVKPESVTLEVNLMDLNVSRLDIKKMVK